MIERAIAFASGIGVGLCLAIILFGIQFAKDFFPENKNDSSPRRER